MSEFIDFFIPEKKSSKKNESSSSTTSTSSSSFARFIPTSVESLSTIQQRTQQQQQQQLQQHESLPLTSLPPKITREDVIAFSAIDACRTICCLSNNAPPDLYFRAAQMIHTFLSRPKIKANIVQESIEEANRDDFICFGAAALFACGKVYTNLNLMRLHKITSMAGTVIRRRRMYLEQIEYHQRHVQAQLEQQQQQKQQKQQKQHQQQNGFDDVLAQFKQNYTSQKNIVARVMGNTNNNYTTNANGDNSTSSSSAAELKSITEDQKLKKAAHEHALRRCAAQEHLLPMSAMETSETSQRIVRWEWVILEANAFRPVGPTPYPFAMTLASMILSFVTATSTTNNTTTLPTEAEFTSTIIAYINDATRSTMLCTQTSPHILAIAAVYCAIRDKYPEQIFSVLNNFGSNLPSTGGVALYISKKYWWATCCVPEYVSSSPPGTHSPEVLKKKQDHHFAKIHDQISEAVDEIQRVLVSMEYSTYEMILSWNKLVEIEKKMAEEEEEEKEREYKKKKSSSKYDDDDDYYHRNGSDRKERKDKKDKHHHSSSSKDKRDKKDKHRDRDRDRDYYEDRHHHRHHHRSHHHSSSKESGKRRERSSSCDSY